MFHRSRQAAQAMVEFALTATLIFFLLAAAVDLGLIFMNMQSLNNAAQEGGQFGSRWLDVQTDGVAQLDYNQIIMRVRGESGSRGGIGFVNMHDLNNDGIPDAMLSDANADGIRDAVDSNGDGRFDLFQYGADTNGDGVIDTVTGLIAEGTQPAGYRRLIDLSVSDTAAANMYQYGRDTNGDGRLDIFTPPLASQPSPAYDPISRRDGWRRVDYRVADMYQYGRDLDCR
ncbi:MAG TPA: pilus assembly protein [Roseiflexaceae bacterium]|nr:pilus assembly protein [Roseiflexaceae bacterium]